MGARIWWPTKAPAATMNATTRSRHSGEPTPPDTAPGTRPIMMLVARMNRTGSRPRMMLTEISSEVRPAPPDGTSAAIRR